MLLLFACFFSMAPDALPPIIFHLVVGSLLIFKVLPFACRGCPPQIKFLVFCVCWEPLPAAQLLGPCHPASASISEFPLQWNRSPWKETCFFGPWGLFLERERDRKPRGVKQRSYEKKVFQGCVVLLNGGVMWQKNPWGLSDFGQGSLLLHEMLMNLCLVSLWWLPLVFTSKASDTAVSWMLIQGEQLKGWQLVRSFHSLCQGPCAHYNEVIMYL